MKQLSIGICGVMGTGKSTLGIGLSKELDLTYYAEPFELNPWIVHSLTTPKPSQHNYDAQLTAITLDFQNRYKVSRLGGIVDAPYAAQGVFTPALYQNEQLDSYQIEALLKFADGFPVTSLDFLICLRADISTILDRIYFRGRSFEIENTDLIDHLSTLITAYEVWLDSQAYLLARDFVVINTDTMTSENVLRYSLKMLDKTPVNILR